MRFGLLFLFNQPLQCHAGQIIDIDATVAGYIIGRRTGNGVAAHPLARQFREIDRVDVAFAGQVGIVHRKAFKRHDDQIVQLYVK